MSLPITTIHILVLVAIRLLNRLGYEVICVQHADSGRALISKGLLRKAQRLAIRNVQQFYQVINDDCPLIGIEPSAILTFRDEYPDLVGSNLKPAALRLAKNVLLVDEFIAREAQKGKITSALFTQEVKEIKVHGHCQQKAGGINNSCFKDIIVTGKL